MSRPLIESGRMDALIDGIFAIASTLLVLELTSHAIGNVTTSGEFLAGLLGMGDQFISFLVSFLLLCLLWMAHVRLFTYIAYIDGNLMRINVLQLLFIVLIPFSTVVDTDYADIWLGRLVMPSTVFPAILLSWLGWCYVLRHRSLLVPDVAEADIADMSRASLIAVLLSALTVARAPFIGSWAFLAFALRPVFDAIRERRRATTTA